MALSSDDKREIEELLSRYCWWIDSNPRPEDFYDIFTEDAVIASSLTGRYEGREGHEAWNANLKPRPGGPPRQPDQLRHVVANVLINGDGDRAAARAYLIDFRTASQIGGRASQLELVGHYHCDVVRVGGKWKMQSRILVMDAIAGGPNDHIGTDYRKLR